MNQTLPLPWLRAIEGVGLSDVRITLARTISCSFRQTKGLFPNRMAIRIISLGLLFFVAMPGHAGDAARYFVDYINMTEIVMQFSR
jgi:hypothetical protein